MITRRKLVLQCIFLPGKIYDVHLKIIILSRCVHVRYPINYSASIPVGWYELYVN